MTGTTAVERTSRFRPCVLLVALVVAACSQSTPSTDQILAGANEAMAAGALVRAEKGYREVLRLAPNDPVALRQLGILYLDQGQAPQAHPLLKQSVELQSDAPDLQLKLGQAALALRQLGQARELALQVLDRKPGDEPALLLLTDTAISPDAVTETRGLIEVLMRNDRDRASYHVALGALALRQKDEARAESELKAALALDPRSSTAHAVLGTLRWSRNDLPAADAAMRAAVELAPPPRAPMWMRYVDFKLATDGRAEARAIVQELHARFPELLPPRVYLMRMACADARAQDECATRAQEILAQHPTSYDAMFQDGVIALSKGDSIKAIRTFQYLSNTYREDPQVRFRLAMSFLAFAGSAGPAEALKAIDSAEGRLGEAIALDPRFDQAILLFAELKIRRGDAPVVIDLLWQLIQGRPQIARAHYLLASAYQRAQRPSDALAVYRRIAELFPQDPQPPVLAAGILLTQGRRPEARRELEASLVIAPDHLPAAEALLDLDLADKRLAAALALAQRQIERHAGQARPWVMRARVHLARQDLAQAEADLQKAIALDPASDEAHQLLAQLYVSSGRREQAIRLLSAFAEQSRTVPVLMQLATIHEQAGNFPAARDAYEKLLAVSPGFVPALNNLAVLSSEHLGRLDVARDLARRAREAAPNEPAIADTLGWILYKHAEYGDARRLLREAAAGMPDNPEVQFHLGMVSYMMGDEAVARLALQKAVDAGGDAVQTAQARQRLALLAIDSATAAAPARAELGKFLREHPDDPAALLRLARLELRDGAADRAARTLEKVVAAHPLHAPAVRQLALLQGGRPIVDARAYELVEKARESYPDDPDLARTLGILSYRRDLYPRAVELLEQAVRVRKDDGELLLYLGAAHRQLRRWKECKGALERAIKSSLSAEQAASVREMLSECSESAAP